MCRHGSSHAALAFSTMLLCFLSSVKETDTHKLWRNIEPHLKKAMQTVYLREVSRSVFFNLNINLRMNHITFDPTTHSSDPACLLWCLLIIVCLLFSLTAVFSGSSCSKWRRGSVEPWEVPTHTERRNTIAEQMLKCKSADRVQSHMLKLWIFFPLFC